MKFAQFCNVFVCDFVSIMNICQDDFHKLYVDPLMVFKDDLFQNFHGLVETTHKEILLMRVINLNISIDHFGFELNN